MPDALGVCQSRMARGLEMLAVCKIPRDHHPYWPYPTANEGHIMVIANIPDFHGTPSDFRVCKLIEVMHDGELCVAFNQTTIGDETLRPDMVALQPVQPRSSLWCNDVFWVLDNDDGSVPAFNSMYFMGTEPKEQVPMAALLYNPTLVTAAEAGMPGGSMDPNPTFIPNEGITWVDTEMQPQPMDVSGRDGHVIRHRGVSPFNAFYPSCPGDTSVGGGHHPSRALLFYLSDASFHHDRSLPNPVLDHTLVLPGCPYAAHTAPCWGSSRSHRLGSIPPGMVGNDEGTG